MPTTEPTARHPVSTTKLELDHGVKLGDEISWMAQPLSHRYRFNWSVLYRRRKESQNDIVAETSVALSWTLPGNHWRRRSGRKKSMLRSVNCSSPLKLTASYGEISCYNIDLEPAHTVLAQACLGGLFQ